MCMSTICVHICIRIPANSTQVPFEWSRFPFFDISRHGLLPPSMYVYVCMCVCIYIYIYIMVHTYDRHTCTRARRCRQKLAGRGIDTCEWGPLREDSCFRLILCDKVIYSHQHIHVCMPQYAWLRFAEWRRVSALWHMPSRHVVPLWQVPSLTSTCFWPVLLNKVILHQYVYIYIYINIYIYACARLCILSCWFGLAHTHACIHPYIHTKKICI